MDEGNVAQQYYIATKSPPRDDRVRVLKYGSMFAVFDRLGNIQPSGLGEHGLFCDGTRHLSQLVVRLWDAPPLLLSSTVEHNNLVFTADLANLDVSLGDSVAIHRGTLHLLRSRFLWRNTAYEEVRVVNYGMDTLHVPVSITFEADFADIFEVRGTHRTKRGQYREPQIAPDCVVLGYEGLDGVTRRTRVQLDPAPHSLNAGEVKFSLELKPKATVEFKLQTSCENGKDRSRSTSYSQALRRANTEMHVATHLFPRLTSSNSRFNDWIRRSADDVEMMTIGNREVNYPYAGVPWFSTVFGRDGIITAMQTLWMEPTLAEGVLKFLAETQATTVDRESEAEPGKILHELRHGEMANLREIPFARYYGTVDATPLYLMLAGAYYERTGNRKLIQEIWPNIQAALKWMDEYGDVDGDGFVEYAAHGKQGLIQQGWKDSNDSVFHADGKIAEPPIALCEVQAYVYGAKLAAARLSHALGDDVSRARLEYEAAELRKKFEDAFWCEDLGVYALALDGKKRPCRVRASNAGHCLFGGIATSAHAKRMAACFFEPQFFSGWGLRTLATGEARYNPLSYHNGSVWPHDNALVAKGLAAYGYKTLAGKILLALLDASSSMELHRLPELFCGLIREEPGEGPVLYPVACSPQAWAAASPFMLIQACLGVKLDGAEKRVVFDRPCLPEGIPHLSIHGLRIGDASVDLMFERQADTVRVQVLEKQGEIDVVASL